MSLFSNRAYIPPKPTYPYCQQANATMPPLPSYTDFMNRHLRTCMELDHEGYDYECAIDMVRPENPVETPCGHIFCRSCLVAWLEANDTCPMCRQKLYSKSISNWPWQLEAFDFSLLPFDVDQDAVLTVYNNHAPHLRLENPLWHRYPWDIRFAAEWAYTGDEWRDRNEYVQVFHDEPTIFLVAVGLFYRNEDTPARYHNPRQIEVIQNDFLLAKIAIEQVLRENCGRVLRIGELWPEYSYQRAAYGEPRHHWACEEGHMRRCWRLYCDVLQMLVDRYKVVVDAPRSPSPEPPQRQRRRRRNNRRPRGD